MLEPALSLALLALTAAQTQATTFNVTDLEVPEIVLPDQKEVELACTYEGNFTILSWFKGPNEFFRFKPGGAPSTRSFPFLGVGRIEILRCGLVHCRLRLGSLTEEATGIYRCDIEKVTPPFKFATRSAYMQVQGHHQQRRPIVEGLADEYGEGDEMVAFCRASQDAEIRWYINEHEMIDMRGAYTFRKKSSRLIFMGIPPRVAVQCAEFRYGNLSGSRVVKARWKETNCNGERAQEQRKNSASIGKNTILIWMFCLNILKNLAM